MTRYLISFDDGAMTIPREDLPAVAEAAHAVVREAKDAGVWVFGGGLHSQEEVSVVSTDGTVTDGPASKAYIGGFSVVDVPSRDEALKWAAKIAVACRCAQEVREFGPGSTL
ncbi:MAG: YciI family protein [Chloroflexota bacterium]|nr:YciI family protein [Chloroflexota bacterium]